MTVYELEWMRALLPQIAGAVPFARVLTELGAESVLFLLIAIVYFAIDRRRGEQIAYIVLFSSCCNGVVKSLIGRPRPFSYDASLAPADLRAKYGGTYSCPSGHSQNAGAFYTALGLHFKNIAVRILCAIAFVLVPLTRIVLGVHFPSDTALGAFLGAAFAAAGYFLLAKAFGHSREKLLLVTFGACVIVPLVVYLPLSFFTAVDPDSLKAFGALGGLCIGLYVTDRLTAFDNTKVWWKGLLRVLIAVALIAGLRFGLKALFGLVSDHVMLDYVRYLLTVGVTMSVCPWLVTKIGLQ